MNIAQELHYFVFGQCRVDLSLDLSDRWKKDGRKLSERRKGKRSDKGEEGENEN